MAILHPSRDVFRRLAESLDRTSEPVLHRERRLLLPAYVFSGVPLAGTCTECGKLFSRTVEEVLSDPMLEAPETVLVEFELHRCALHLLSQRIG